VREALKALIERESARRLARLGGSEPDLIWTRDKRLHAVCQRLALAAPIAGQPQPHRHTR
jgi:hypothetical protein